MTIEKRRWKRVPVNIDATINSGNLKYNGHIISASVDNIGYLIASMRIIADGFCLEKTINLRLKDHSGKRITIECETKWFEWEASKGYATIGLKIIKPPSAYKKFIEKLIGGMKEHTE